LANCYCGSSICENPSCPSCRKKERSAPALPRPRQFLSNLRQSAKSADSSPRQLDSQYYFYYCYFARSHKNTVQPPFKSPKHALRHNDQQDSRLRKNPGGQPSKTFPLDGRTISQPALLTKYRIKMPGIHLHPQRPSCSFCLFLFVSFASLESLRNILTVPKSHVLTLSPDGRGANRSFSQPLNKR
jgi:hypothetical protein